MKKDPYIERISVLLMQWVELKKELSYLFEGRERSKTLQPMEAGIDIFYQLLGLSNEIENCEVNRLISNFEWKPVNVLERLDFIKQRPDLYHSFIQLTELINEQEKLYNKKRVLKK